MFRRRKILLILILLIVLLTAAAYGLLFTTSGSTLVTRLAVSRYTKLDDIEIKKSEGSLSDKLIWRDVVIRDVGWLPEGSILTVAELEADLDFFNSENS